MSRKLSISTASRAVGMTALSAAALAACTVTPRYPIQPGVRGGDGFEVARPRYPTQGSPETRRAGETPVRSNRGSRGGDDDDAPRTAPSGSVSSRSLPSGSNRSSRSTASTRPAAGAASTPSVAAARPPVLTTPGRITVRQGETLFDIAERFRAPVRAIIEANGLTPPYSLAPGSTLILPPPLVYTVQEGDTLFGIARRFNIDPRSLANLNDIAPDAAMTRGRPIALPSLARDQGVNPQAVGPSPVGSTLGRAGGEAGLRGGLPATERSPSPTTVAPRARKTEADAREAVAAAARKSPATASPAPAAAGPTTDAQVVAAGRGRFIAPLKGTVIASFGAIRPGQRNDGVNIAAAQGTLVRAAAAGEVVYAGSAIPGYGNLVLIKHAGGWVTAYAHLDSIAVKMRAAVGQGDKLGEVGQSGGVDQPQLHFEIRFPPEPDASAKPIDPSLVVPGLR